MTTMGLSLIPSQAQPRQEAVIRVSSNLVAVPVLVTDHEGQPVMDLAAGDFQVEQDGRPQRIVRLGEPGSAPVEMALLFDVSASINGHFLLEQRAATEFLHTVLRPVDSVSVFVIGSKPSVALERTNELDRAVEAVMNLTPTKEATAFHDTVVAATTYLARTSNPGSRRVLVVISDGEDNHSEHAHFSDALGELQRADCLFYSLNPNGPSIHLNEISMRGQKQMEALAADIGGAFVIDKPENMPAVFRKIAHELQAQYLLGFYSADEAAAGNYRRIAVLIPGRPDLRVRARQGFYAPKCCG